MRKKVWMALAGCVILGLSGCGSTASDTAQEVQDSASEDTEEEASEKTSWYGTRVVTETKAAEVSALSEEEISGKVGNTVTYEANTVQINEEQQQFTGCPMMGMHGKIHSHREECCSKIFKITGSYRISGNFPHRACGYRKTRCIVPV